MERRYHLQNDTHLVEFPFTDEGRRQAAKFRSENSAFKRRKIRDIIQAYPSLVPFGEIVDIGAVSLIRTK